MSTSQRHPRLSKVALGVGFASLLLGVITAYRTPATGYELSLFAETPLVYFLGLGVALLVSVWFSFRVVNSRPLRNAALLLGGLSVTSLVMLPLIRGYYLYGTGDSMTHLGWTREILWGQLEPTGLLYPGIHTMTVFFTEVTGIRLGLSQMHVTMAFVLVYIVFVMLCVRLLGCRKWAVPVGLFAGLLLLPNNNVSIHVQAHPITQSLLFLPFVLYLVLMYVVRDGEWMNPFDRLSQSGVLLALSSITLILLHPQGALNLILVLLVVAAVQFFFRRYRQSGFIDTHRPVYVPTAIAVVAFSLWAPRHERVRNAAEGVINQLLFGATPADEITQRTTSLTDIGGSVGTLFIKLFGVALVFCVLAALLMAVWSSGRLDERFPERNALLSYLVIALVPLLAAFAVFFLSSSNTMHFRYIGFLMVPVTILGALAVTEGADALVGRFSSKQVRVGLVVVFLLLLPLPLATIHSTPFVFKPSDGVSEMRYEGFNSTVDQMDREIAFAGIRAGPGRLIDATQGTERALNLSIGNRASDGAIPGPVFSTNLTSHYEGQRYIPADRSDYLREVVLYDELRYSEEGFQQLDTAPQIDRVKTTGEYRLYLLTGEN